MRTLIVDDEEPARWRVRELLARHPDVEIVGTCENGREAIAAIERLRPDLLFLDVQMPELDGFAVLAAVRPDILPLTIFVTAYDQYAVRAFDTHALDYVLKPFSDERLERALARARTQRAMQDREAWTTRVMALLREQETTAPSHTASEASKGALHCLVVRSSGKAVVLDAGEIDWIEAAGVYVQVHAGRETYLHRMPLAELEARLAQARFVRIHRSALVNLDRIRELSPHPHGEFTVVLKDGTPLRLSRRYRAHLEARLGQPL